MPSRRRWVTRREIPATRWPGPPALARPEDALRDVARSLLVPGDVGSWYRPVAPCSRTARQIVPAAIAHGSLTGVVRKPVTDDATVSSPRRRRAWSRRLESHLGN